MADGIETVGAKLRARREALGLSLRQAGKLAEPPLGSAYLMHIETDYIKSPRVAVIPQLAQAYQVPMAYIMEAFGVTMDVTADPADPEALRIGNLVLSLPEIDRQAVEDFAGFLRDKPNPQTA